MAEKKSNAINKTARRANHLGFSEIMSSQRIKNISVFTNPKSAIYPLYPVPFRGAYHDRHETWGGNAVDAGSADSERRESVRQRRVVLTPRCWRQVGGSSPADDGGKRAGRRGERVISCKATAQGMSDCLRCPVCSCAQPTTPLRTRSRVQRASGIPCSLAFRGNGFQNPGIGPRDRE